jgi:ParB family chromosome partitioning protein
MVTKQIHKPRPKLDLINAFDAISESATKVADERFSVASQILDSQPHGLSASPGGANVAQDMIPREDDLLVVGRSYNLPLNRLVRSENNARVFYSPDELDEMTKSLIVGQDISAIGYVKGQKVVIIDGGKRLQASVSGGLETLRVEISEKPATAADEYETSRRINNERSGHTLIDDAVRLQDLLDRQVYANREEICNRLGYEVSALSKILSLKKIPERLLRSMNQHEKTRTLSTAYELSRIFEVRNDDHEAAARICEDAIERIKKHSLNRDEAKAIVDELLSTKKPTARERAKTHEVRYGEAKGIIKIFPNKKRFELTLNCQSMDTVEKLKEVIEQALAGQIGL